MSDQNAQAGGVRISAYTAWCLEQGCTHGHCPLGCEHPQPSTYAGTAQVICGVCYFADGTINEIVPCLPEMCPD